MAGSDGETLESIKRGDTEYLYVTITKPEDGTPQDITNNRLVFEARLVKTDVSPFLIKTSDLGGGIEKTNALNGEATITINKEDMLPLIKNTTLHCQLSSIDAQGRPNTILFKLPVLFRHV